MNEFRRKTQIVEAVQWAAYDAAPAGFKVSPPPTDFGIGRSCWNDETKVLLHFGDWAVCIDGKWRRMTDHDFKAMYEPAVEPR